MRAARHAVRRGRALPGLRRQGRELRCREGQGRPRREAAWCRSRAASRWSPTTPGPRWRAAGARSQVGRRRRSLRSISAGIRQDVRRASASSPAPWRARIGDARGRARRRREEDRSGLRGAVPGARSHGAAQLHRRRARRQLRSLGVHARPDRRARDRRCRSPACRPRRSQVHTRLHGRRLRPPRRARTTSARRSRSRRRSAFR